MNISRRIIPVLVWGLFTPSPTDYDTEEAIQANRLKKKKKKPKRKRGFSL